MLLQKIFHTIFKKFTSYSFLVKIKKLLMHLKLFNYLNSLIFIGMLAILLTRKKLSEILDFFIQIYLHGVEYVKLQHLSIDYYQKWIKYNSNYNIKVINEKINEFSYKPIISLIIVISDDRHSRFLKKVIESIFNQFYSYWELIIYDNIKNSNETYDCLKKWNIAGDARIRIITDKACSSTPFLYNSALQKARGEFFALIGEADDITPDALYEVARLINAYPEAEIIYSDEDKIREDGIRFDPFFKPDWAPDFFRSMMYTGNMSVYRRDTVLSLGGFREGFGAASAYDLVLRVIEVIRPAQIIHLPRILYHVRSYEADLNRPLQVADMSEGGKIALEDACQRNCIPGIVEDGLFQGSFRFRRFWPDNPKVSIIIPFRDKVHLTERCITSILNKTNYQNYEVILVNNQSQEPQTMAYLEEISSHPIIRLLSYDYSFNFSAINNFAVEKSEADYIVFLNNDTEVIAPAWLDAMMEHIQREEVGAVGSKLLYYDNTIQHAGVIIGITNSCGHAYRRFPADHPGYFGQLQMVRNCSAVTAACMLVKKALFQAVGGFDQKNLPVSYNDVDLCLKFLDKGFLIVWTPYSLLYHQEYSSRGDDRNLQGCSQEKYNRIVSELDFFDRKWNRYIKCDPYYNQNLTRLFENYGF
jgi:GT2 family glycosyltransferase